MMPTSSRSHRGGRDEILLLERLLGSIGTVLAALGDIYGMRWGEGDRGGVRA